MNRLLVFIAALLASVCPLHVAQAQDNQFTQYYNAPQYLNPAFTGTGMDTRFGANYRLQWPGLGSPFKNYSVWADHNLVAAKSGIGMLIRRDAVGKTGISSTDVNFSYAYQVDLGADWAFRAGLQLGFGMRSLDYQELMFGDQLDANGVTGNPTGDPLANNGRNSKLYPDVSAGGLLFNSNYYIGLSAYHLNGPNLAFAEGDVDNLPIRMSLHTGYTINLQQSRMKNAPTREIIPNAQFRMQGNSTQLDLGVYTLWEPFTFGVMYRGVPFSKYENSLTGNEALAFMAGMHYNELTIGYSYDLTLSGLGLKNSGGVHEISVIYEILLNPKNLRRGKSVPCPNFSRRYQ